MATDFDSLWDYSRPGVTEEKFRALLSAAEAASDPTYLAQLLTQIARTQGLQGQFAAAHATLDRVESLLADTLPPARIRYLLERGRVLNTSGQPAAARPYFLEAWNLAREAGEDFHAVDAAHMLGVVESLTEQLEWSGRALELAEASPDPRVHTWLGPLYNNLGWSFHDLGRYDEALDLFRRSFAWRRAQGQERETRIAAWTIGRCLRSLGRIEEALELQTETLQAAHAAGEADGAAEEEIGECLLALGRSTEARQHFSRAHAALSGDAWVVEHEAPRLERLADLARR